MKLLLLPVVSLAATLVAALPAAAGSYTVVGDAIPAPLEGARGDAAQAREVRAAVTALIVASAGHIVARSMVVSLQSVPLLASA